MARPGYYSSPAGQAIPAKLAAIGVTHVALQVTIVQETWASTRIYRDFRYTPADREVADFVALLRSHGIAVMLKPMLQPLDGKSRNSIWFPPDDKCEMEPVRRGDYWAQWLESFAEATLHYARLAQASGCVALCLGCELDGALRQDAAWSLLVAKARAEFRGELTYDTSIVPLIGAQGAPAWLKELDFLSLSFYPRGSEAPGATVTQMVATLAPAIAQVRTLAATIGRPVVFGECGCRSRVGGALVPWEYRANGAYDGQEQANYLDAILTAAWGEPWWRGLYVWKWDEHQKRPHYATDPAGDLGFTVEGKPATAVLARWYARTDR